jgi:hypothetical protein
LVKSTLDTGIISTFTGLTGVTFSATLGFTSCAVVDKKTQTRAKVAQSFFQLLIFFFPFFSILFTLITIQLIK